MKKEILFSSVIFFALISTAQAQLLFNISATGNEQADAGFAAAAAYIQSQFDDNLTINLTTGFRDLGGNILGSAGSSNTSVSYTDFRNAVASDRTSTDDYTFSASLKSGESFQLLINETSEASGGSKQNTYLDTDGFNTTRVRLNTANAKALGLLDANNSGNDVTINFSNQYTWDFDPSDGIDTGAIDFVGVAIHEIMHGMGFVSGVDTLDRNDDGAFSDNDFDDVRALDFTRFSADSLVHGVGTIDWTADNRDKFYSIDGGMTPGSDLGGGTNHWSTGIENGDGRQASHWKDGLDLGIMDPTAQPAGTANFVTALDLQALDVIGWNRTVTAVPEPSTMAMTTLLLGGFGMWRRRKKTKGNLVDESETLSA